MKKISAPDDSSISARFVWAVWSMLLTTIASLAISYFLRLSNPHAIIGLAIIAFICGLTIGKPIFEFTLTLFSKIFDLLLSIWNSLR